jgi:hypothetical protein
VQADSFAGPVGHRDARELGAVVAAQHGRVATHGRDAVEFVDEVVAGDGAFDESAEAFAGVFVDDRCDLDRAAVASNWKSTAQTVFGAFAVSAAGMSAVRASSSA